VVLLPTYAEVQEVSTKVKAWTPRQFKAASFPVMDLGSCSFSQLGQGIRTLGCGHESPWCLADKI